MSTLNHFHKDCIQIGDKAFYILKECDISSSSTKRCKDEQSSSLKEQPDHKKSKQPGKYKETSIDDVVSVNR